MKTFFRVVLCFAAHVFGLAMVASVVSCENAMSSTNWLRGSEDEIHASILAGAPTGTSIEKVKSYLAEKGWTISYDTTGAQTQLSEKFYPGVKGQHIIGANLGHYLGAFGRVDVEAFWGFDVNSRLVDVHVRKGVSAL
jgi:hypothetical protein